MKHYKLSIIGQIGYEKVITPYGIFEYLGGSAYYTLIGALLEFEVENKYIGFVTRLGNDVKINQFTDYNLDMSLIQKVNEKSPRYSIEYNKEFSIINTDIKLNCEKKLNPKDFLSQNVKSDYVHVATMPAKQQYKIISSIRKFKTCQISFDTTKKYILKNYDTILKSISNSNLIFLSENEYKLFPHEVLNNCKLIVKKAEKGVDYYDNGIKLYSFGTKKVKVMDPTGAGDVFAGVFLGARSQGKNVKNSLKKGLKIATKSVTKPGVEFLLNN